MFENIKKFWKYFIVNEESEISKEKDEKCEIKNIDEETEIDELTSQIIEAATPVVTGDSITDTLLHHNFE